MSKIRVYELAKEAEMSGKSLADKLIELGYDVKGHSSTVTDEVADEIRRKVLGTVKTEVEEKRISAKGGTTVIRRRSRTVRQEIPVAEVEIQVPAGTETLEEPPAGEDQKPVETEAVEAPAEEAGREKEGEPVIEASLPSEEGEAVSPPETVEEEPTVELTESEDETEAEPVATPKVKSRKGLAKVIKRAAIDIPVEEPAKSRPARPVRVVKTRPKMTPAVGVPDALFADDGQGAKGDVVKGRKKGKRLVQIRADEPDEGFRRQAGAKRKGRRQLEADGRDYFGRSPKKGRGKAGAQHAASAEPVAETKAIKKRIIVFETITVGDLAHKMGVKVNQVIANLMGLGVMATMNQALDVDSAGLVAADFGYAVEQGITDELHVLSMEEQESGGEALPRPPVVTVMGHVDHGKTSILDAIRKTDVVDSEAGGITQHIGAYYVRSSAGDVVFLDTPGHAAFTEMRSRGAQVTDVVVLVVAADDGVMDQTKEAINHAQAAKVPIVVAVNKIDKPDADPMRVMRELGELGLVPEAWGGDTIFCETSAKQNIGIEELLANIHLQAEILELKADPQRKARGRVIEAQLHKGRGAVATVLIQEGTLRAGQPCVAGQYYGKVRSLINDKGVVIKEAGPAMPVEVQGLSGVPQAGDEFIVVSDEKMAKNVSASRQLKAREMELASSNKISLDKLFEQMQQGEVKELRVVLRSDVQGTLEAFGKAIEKLSTDEVKVKVLHEGTGTITESDVLLASASEAIIIGFNVRPTVKVKELAGVEKVDIRSYDVIYHALDDIRKAMTGMLSPTYEERVTGTAEVRETFSVPKVGTIAGCHVVDGKVERKAKIRVLRDGVVVYTGDISSLRRFKDDVKEVLSGYECGISVENFNDIKMGDVLETFVMDEVAAKL